MYPKFIEEAEGEGRKEAAESFRIAFEREKYHRAMFQQALKQVKWKVGKLAWRQT